ncbi:TAXI family TRAP transporter solute-binding subunit, partial [Thermodesulfobacteriota bacterium]
MKTKSGLRILSLAVFLTALLMLSPPPIAAKRVVLIASGGATGTGKDLRVQMVAEAMRQANPDWVISVLNGFTGAAEINMMREGKMHFTALDAAELKNVEKGHFFGHKLSNPVAIRWILPSTAMTCSLIMIEKVPFNSYREFKEKKYPFKFSMGRKKTDPYFINEKVMKAYGYSPEDIIAWGGKRQNQATRRSAELISDGLMEGMFLAGTFPNPAMVELSRKRKLKTAFVSDPAIQAKLEGEDFIVVPIKTVSGASFVKEDTTTVACPAVIAGPASLEDDVAYNMARGVWEQREK